MLEILQYIGILVVLGTSVVGLWKNWSKEPKKYRWLMSFLISLGVIISLVSTNLAKKESQRDLNMLMSAEETTRNVLSEQTSVLFDRVVELEAKVLTEELQKELNATRAELERTQEALKPGPNAKIVFSLVEGTEKGFDENNPREEIFLPVIGDTVTVKFLALNATDVYAKDVGIWVHIPKGCEYLEKPEMFKKLDMGGPQTLKGEIKNWANFILLGLFEFKIKVPISVSVFNIDIRVRCPMCGPFKKQVFWINIIRA